MEIFIYGVHGIHYFIKFDHTKLDIHLGKKELCYIFCNHATFLNNIFICYVNNKDI